MPVSYAIIEDRTGATGYCPRGAALDLWRYRGPEAIIAGPAESGKTRAALQKLHAQLLRYPGAQAVLVRKVRDTIYPTCLQTYLHKVLLPGTPVKAYGGERPGFFDYPNGSRLWLAGFDDPGKALSSERDFVLVNQAEELSLGDWAILTSRATGRAGHAPYGQVIGDANPGPSHHWILHREGLKIFQSRHEDNPTLWDAEVGDWTEQGRRTIDVLDRLPGVLRERLRFGRWVSAEGTVFQLDPRVHCLDLAGLRATGVIA